MYVSINSGKQQNINVTSDRGYKYNGSNLYVTFNWSCNDLYIVIHYMLGVHNATLPLKIEERDIENILKEN